VLIGVELEAGPFGLVLPAPGVTKNMGPGFIKRTVYTWGIGSALTYTSITKTLITTKPFTTFARRFLIYVCGYIYPRGV